MTFFDLSLSFFAVCEIETVVYTPKGASGVSIDATVARGDYMQDHMYVDGEYVMKKASVTFEADLISGDPDLDGDTVTFDSLKWAVTGFHAGRGNKMVVNVERKEPIKKQVKRRG